MTDLDNNRVDLLDGGLGQELVRRSPGPITPLWSAQVMLDDPELVTEVHRDFVAAGADVLTLNTYSSTQRRLARAGLGDRFEAVQRAAVEAGVKVRREAEASGRRVRLAGCLPPLVASYRPETTPPFEEALAEYREIVALQAPEVDLFLCETMASTQEAVAAVTAAKESGLPVWCAMTVDDRDGRSLRSGEPLREAAAAARKAGAEASLVNCSSPEATAEALEVLTAPFGAYANGFSGVEALEPGGTVEVLEARRDLSPEVYADHVDAWIRKGASIVGGCCEVGPQHITEIARRRAG